MCLKEGDWLTKTMITAKATADSTCLRGDPLYVEVSPLLGKYLAGIGRFAARLIEALARSTPLRLVNTIQGEHARNMRLSRVLRCGQEIAVTHTPLPCADTDLEHWTRRLFYRRPQRHDARLAERCAVLYTMLRPPERHFRRELCLLHDFTPVLLPDFHVAETREHFGALFTRTAALCDKLLANSHSTRADAGWLCRVAPEKVVVCYPGPTLCVHQHAWPEPVARRDNVLLVVSTLEPRKNGPFLFHWFQNTYVLDAEMELWWVGPRGWGINQASGPRRGAGRRRKIRFLGTVPDRTLCQLYRQASFTIYPSLYEGFGFPVLDSLRHGTPVLSSFHSSLQEFAGPGVFYFDPCNPASLDEACRELLAVRSRSFHRPDLDERFSWEAMARRVLSLSA
jgi:glycosyltransferase involved in cell wall biosynthesis